MRTALEQVERGERSSNPGLVWAVAVEHEELKDKPRSDFLAGIAKTKLPQPYSNARRKYEQAVRALGDTHLYTAVTATPLAIGLGGGSVFEVGFTFLRPYGVPYIPGSSIKGAMKRVAAVRCGVDAVLNGKYQPDKKIKDIRGQVPEDKQADVESFLNAFGTTEGAAFFDIFDAWITAGDPQGHFLMSDIVNPHHPGYYRGEKGHEIPHDWDSPVPVTFVSIRPGVTVQFAFRCAENWVKFCRDLLEDVLTKRGIGAKTNAGYGYFKDFKACEPT